MSTPSSLMRRKRMTNKTDDVIVKQVEQDVLIEGLTKQLQNIDDKLDKLIKTINASHHIRSRETTNKILNRISWNNLSRFRVPVKVCNIKYFIR